MRRSVLLFMLLGCCACSGPSSGDVAAWRRVVRLLDRLGEARIEAADEAVMHGELREAAAGDVALLERFGDATAWPGPWVEQRVLLAAIEDPRAAAAMPRISTAPERVNGAGVLRLDDADRSLVALVPAAAEESWLVRARMRTLRGGDAETGGIAWVPLRFDPPPVERLVARAPELFEELRARPRQKPLEANAGAQWQELRLLARPYPGRKAIAVSLLAGEGGALVDEVEVRRLTPAEALALTQDDSVEPIEHPLRRRVSIDLETWDSLVLPAPARAAFEVVVPRRSPRLDIACAALLDGRDQAVTFRVELRGRKNEVLWESERRADGAREMPFETASVDLLRFAGRRVTLALAAEGPRGAVALFGAPSLLGAPDAEPAPPPRAPPPRPRVLLVSLDTLRADHLGCYGRQEAATPRIDALAAEGTRFEHVLSPASFTLPTHLSMLSGQDPLVHETVKSTQPMDPARTAMLAQRARDAGWRTAAFTGGGLVHPRYGFGVGFDSYSCRDPGGVVGVHRRIGDQADRDAQPGEDRMGEVVAWLERNADQPFFLFVHTYLVHNYRPAQENLDAIGGGPRPTLVEGETIRRAAVRGDRAAIERLRTLYRASIAQADREIVGRLLDALDALGLADSTLVVLTADHGEEFFEHEMIGHGAELWHSLTRVPWILRGPGVPRGEAREDPVSLADVAPTIAAWAGLPDDPRVLGRDQLAADPADNFTEPRLLSLRDVADRPDQEAVVLWPWKLVRRREGEPPWPARLYRLDEDPGETSDLTASEPERAAGLLRLLQAKLREQNDVARSLPSSDRARSFEMPLELEWMLDQLGYGRDKER